MLQGFHCLWDGHKNGGAVIKRYDRPEITSVDDRALEIKHQSVMTRYMTALGIHEEW